jgi:cytidine deaminase
MSIGIGPRDLFDTAWDAMQKTHSPYSKFPVGASLRTQDGRIYSGCNVEIASYPEGWCAETTMLAHYVMGGRGKITEICVVAGKMARCTPCGGCRQRLSEFAGPDAKLYLCDETGIVQATTLGAIFPLGFEGDTLK